VFPLKGGGDTNFLNPCQRGESVSGMQDLDERGVKIRLAPLGRGGKKGRRNAVPSKKKRRTHDPRDSYIKRKRGKKELRTIMPYVSEVEKRTQ